MKGLFFLIILFMSFLKGYGQYTLCDCCTYESLFWTDNFEKWFPAESIKKNNFHELTIYVTSKQTAKAKNDSSIKTIDTEYRQMIFKFDNNGFVSERIFFTGFGQYNSTNEFIRNGKNKIVAKTFFYLDSTGTKMENFIPQKWIYDYDNNGNLIRLKELGDKFIELPDSQSNHFTYRYDEFGRVIQSVSYTYYKWTDPYSIVTNTIYSKKLGKSISTYEGNLTYSEKTTYNAGQNPIKIVKYYEGKKIGTRTYVYDSEKHLIKLKTTSVKGHTECLDGGNLIEVYSYNNSNLLTAIKHSYRNTVCNLRFDFK